jgi:hypothetical protein
MANEAQGKPRYPGILWPTVITLSTVFLMGVTAGYLNERSAQSGDGPSALVGGGLVLLAGIVVMGLYLRRFGPFWQSWSRRKRLYMASIFGSGALGLITAMLMRAGESDSTASPFYSNSALSPEIAVALALIWGIGISIALFVYQRTVDDHERQAYLRAGLAGYYAFVIPAPAWWVLARASLAPPVNAMQLFMLTIVVNAAVYLWLKFR